MSWRFYSSLPWIILLWFLHFLFLPFYFFSMVFSFLGLSALASAVSAAAGATLGSFLWSSELSSAHVRLPLHWYAKTTKYEGILKYFLSLSCQGIFSTRLRTLEICLEPKYTRLIPEKFSFWASAAARFFFFFLHPNQCGLIQGCQLGLVRLCSSSIWLFNFLWCSVL